MKKILLIISIVYLFFGGIGFSDYYSNNNSSIVELQVVDAAVKVKGYYRKDGTYVKPHYRSSPDGNPYNNWSFPGNTNPYTGEVAPGNPETYLKNYYGEGNNSITGSSSTITYPAPVSTGVVSDINNFNITDYGINFNRNLKMGMSGSDVKQLQIILNRDPATRVSIVGAGSPGRETYYFGSATFNAVMLFQTKYASEILWPVGIYRANGFVGPQTRSKLNTM